MPPLWHCGSECGVPKAGCFSQLWLFRIMVKHIAENLKLVIKKPGGEIGQFVESFLKWLSCTGSLGRSGFNAWPGSAAPSVNSFIWVFKGWAHQTLVLNPGLYFFCSLFLQIQNNTSLPCWNVERIPDYLQGQQISFYLGTSTLSNYFHCFATVLGKTTPREDYSSEIRTTERQGWTTWLTGES